ncbi:MAG TPA: hypothetical protein VIU44_14405, partial [Gaiellaceae bacterium]
AGSPLLLRRIPYGLRQDHVLVRAQLEGLLHGGAVDAAAHHCRQSLRGAEEVFSIAVSTLVLVAFFAPFSYLVDTMTYRMWAKRAGRTAEQKSPRSKR